MAGEVGIAVVGVGRIGRLHAHNLHHHIPEASLRALSDVNSEALRACAQELGAPLAVDDHRAVVEKADVDAVVICSSTDTHSQIIQEAAAAGKHIF
ncbi:MAG: Gfo/Idh/MocA family oxidoreductase, partial [Gemmatimonadales bacterium]|nr:Gfo/Idh/MocA family oxidoreductase [Gemmatimonadales bacterium]